MFQPGLIIVLTNIDVLTKQKKGTTCIQKSPDNYQGLVIHIKKPLSFRL